MEPTKYKVKFYYSGFCTYEVEAENESGAIVKVRNRQIDSVEILSALESWEEADIAELKNYENC